MQRRLLIHKNTTCCFSRSHGTHLAWNACCSTMSRVSRDSSKYWVHQASMHTLCGSHLKRALYPERDLCPRRRALCLERAAHFGWVHVWCAHMTRKRSTSTFPPQDGQCYSGDNTMHERSATVSVRQTMQSGHERFMHERFMLRGSS